MKFPSVKKLVIAALLFAGALEMTTAQAQINSTNFTGSYSENFDEIGATGTALPGGFLSMVIAGGNSDYEAANPEGPAAIASATADTQTLIIWNAGAAATKSGTQTYNIGCWDGLSDRALGTDPTGTAAQVIQLSMTNGTGGPLYGVNFSYDCKCLTNGSAGTEESELPGYIFFYSLTGSTKASDWVQVGVAGSAAYVGGVMPPLQNGLCTPNYTQGTTMHSGIVMLQFATPLPAGGIMYFRWCDDNNVASSPDQMIAIDNINITTYTPTGPQVSITTPANNATITPGSSIPITASASETGGTITNVAFYSGSTLLGNATTSPYGYTWTGVPAGAYALTVVASDSLGLKTTSSVVNISVAFGLPTVSLTAPASGASFSAPASISLAATASDSYGTLTSVSFYEGSSLLSTVTSAPYTYTWANVPAGSYTLTAQATDNNNSTGTSTAVTVTVTNSPVGSFTGSYSENFDTDLAGGTTVMPVGFEAMYLPGSHFTYTNGTPIDSNAIVTSTLGTQTLVVWNVPSAVSDAEYQLFNIGCWGSLTDRALGTDPTGTAGTVIQLALTNNTGGPLSSVTFSYTEKCLTNGSTSNGSYTDDGTERLELPGYAFFYSITGDNTAANWYPSQALSLTNWVEGTQSNSGPVMLTFPAPLPVGGVMYFRWADDNCVASSPDQMYAIDNISISSTALPVTSIISPANGANLLSGNALNIVASASETGGTIASVGFYIAGYGLVYTANAPNYGPYYALQLPAADVVPGTYGLTVVATDGSGNSTTSSLVTVTVTTAPVPSVSITSPANNANFTPGSSIPIAASASESSGSIASVAFYAGSTLLGTATTVPYSYTWPSVPAANYALKAVATDALGASVTSSVVNISVGVPYLPPTVSLATPTNYTVVNVPGNVTLSAAAAASAPATITNVAFYQGATLLGNVASSPFNFIWSNPAANSYLLTAVATDSTGASTTSSTVHLTIVNVFATSVLQQIKTIFVIPLENHDLTQSVPTGSPQQLLGNPACPYFNSLITPGNPNSAQTSYAVKYYSTAMGEHPSEPNYIWAEAGTEFGTHTDNDPSTGSGNLFSGVTHLSGQLTGAGIAWKDYQEDVQYSSSAAVSASGGNGSVNLYNGTTEYSYAVKHNPMEFFTDTQNKNVYPLAQFFTDLGAGAVGRYNWITPDQYNEMHSSLPSGYTYHGTLYTGDQAAIAEGDNFLSIVIPQIMATAAYQNNGVIIIWTDETESTDDTHTTLPYVVISPLCKGNAYASSVVYSHSSDLKTMDELFGLAFQTNPIPAASVDATGTGSNYVFAANDISDMFQGVGITSSENPGGSSDNITFTAMVVGNSTPGGTVQFLTNGVVAGAPVALVGSAANFSTATLPIGANLITVQYSGDANNQPSTNSMTQTITNYPPAVSISSPANNANYNVGDSIYITANASEVGGSIAGVAFYSGSTLLGTSVSSPYSYAWTGAGFGTDALTAVATDALGNSVTSSVVNITVAAHLLPTVALTGPAGGSSYAAPANLALTATASDTDGNVTNVAFYQGTTLLGSATTAPYALTTANLFAGTYALTAVATDDSGASATSSVVSVTVTNTPALAILQSIKTVFVVAMENHDLVQKNPTGSPEQMLGNPAAPYFNSLITPGNPNAAQTAWATHMFSCAINGEHPSEPNYIWQEAGTDFGIRTDNDPSVASHNLFSNVMHLSGQLQAAGISWKTYQEDVQYSTSEEVSASGSGKPANPYNGTTQYNYGVKHNPMAFFTDTTNKNCYPMATFLSDLANNTVARYNWVTPDQYNEWHSALSGGYMYQGVHYTGDQAAIASGDNCLSILIPQIMASAAYQDHGVIIIWTDETESTDDTNTTLPYVIISPMAKGNAYASTLPYSHASDLKTMDEIFGLAYQTNAIPATYYDAQNDGKYDYVDGHSASINDLSDFFQGTPEIASSENPSGYKDSVTFTASVLGNIAPTGTVQFLTNGVAAGAPVALVQSAASFSTTLLPRGFDLITAQYSGDGHNPASTNSLTQTVTNHPPVAGIVNYTRADNIPVIIAVSDLLTNVTDADGDAITLIGVGTDGANLLTTNGATLMNNGSYLFYTNSVTPNVNDSFEYSVSDGNGGTSLGKVLITINNSLTGQTGANLTIGTTNVTASFFGVPGYRYAIDRSTNLMTGAGLGWVPISTNTAPAGGLIQIRDNFQDLGIPIPPLPSQVFYRLRYNP